MIPWIFIYWWKQSWSPRKACTWNACDFWKRWWHVAGRMHSFGMAVFLLAMRGDEGCYKVYIYIQYKFLAQCGYPKNHQASKRNLNMYVCKGDSCSFKKFWSDSMLGFWQCSSFLNRSTEAQNSLEWRTKQSPRSISELEMDWEFWKRKR